jgi:hypothetical protein
VNWAGLVRSWAGCSSWVDALELGWDELKKRRVAARRGVEQRAQKAAVDPVVGATRVSEANVDDVDPVMRRLPQVVDEEEDGGSGRRRLVGVRFGCGRRGSGRGGADRAEDD